MECRRIPTRDIAPRWKGGALWLDQPTARPCPAFQISAISRRNFSGATSPTETRSTGLREAAYAICRRRLPADWRGHGASNFPIDPRLSSEEAPAFWRAEDNPQVIVLAASNDHAIAGSMHIVAEKRNSRGRHLVLERQGRRSRLSVVAPEPGTGPSYLLSADPALDIRLAALQVICDRPSGRSRSPASGCLRPSPYQSFRFRLMLKILDAAGSAPGEFPSMRELADILGRSYEADQRAIDWKSSSTRRQTQRLVAEARRMAASGYRDLLYAGRRRAFQTP